MNEFFAVWRGCSDHDSAGINNRGAAAEPQVIIFTNAVRCNYIALIFDRACRNKHSPMFVAWKRPSRREQKNLNVLFGHQFSKQFRKPQIVADAEAKTQIAKRK